MSILKVWERLRTRVDGALPQGSLRRRFGRGAFWTVTGAMIAQGLGLMASILVARLLGRAGFGEMGIIRSTVAMFGVFAGLGLGVTATKYVAEFGDKDRARAGRLMGLCLTSATISGGAIAIGVFLLSPLLAARVIDAPGLVLQLRTGCLLLFSEALFGTYNGILAGLESFRTVAKVSLFRGLLNFPCMVIGVWFWGLQGVVAGLVVSGVAGVAAAAIALRHETAKRSIPISFHNLRAELPALWRFALPALLSSSLYGPVLWLARVILRHVSGGFGSLGLYEASLYYEAPVLFLSVQLGAAMLPILSSLDAEEEGRRQSRRVMSGSFAALLLVVVPIVAALSGFSGEIMSWYGREFRDGGPVLAAVLFVAAAKAFGSLSGTAIASKGAMWSGFLINLAWAVLVLVFVALWAADGALGFANAFAAAYACSTVYGLLFVGVKRFMPWRLILRIFLGTVLVGAVSYGMLCVEGLVARLLLVLLSIVIVVGHAVFTRRGLLAPAAVREAPAFEPPGEDISCTF